MARRKRIWPSTKERGLVRRKDIIRERRIKRINKTINFLLFFIIPIVLVLFATIIQRVSFAKSIDWMTKSGGIVLINIALIYMVFFALNLLSKKPALSFFLTTLIYLSLPVISKIKYDVRGEVLVLGELSLIKNLGEILSFVEISTSLKNTLLIVLIFVLLMMIRIIAQKIKAHRITSFVGFLLSVAFIIVIFSNSEMLKKFGINENVRYSYNIIHDNQGTIIGLYSNYVLNKVDKPDEYNKEKVFEILDNIYASKTSGEFLDAFGDVIEEKDLTDKTKPDVIMIMSESFFDPTTLSNVSYSQDPIPNIRKLMKENISGNFISSTFGGGTSNIEYEAFTGTSSEFMPYGTVPYVDIPLKQLNNLQTIQKDFKNSGYKTIALHTYIGSFYNRDKVYPILGFEVFKDVNDLQEVGYYGKYVGDVTMYKNIIAELEKDKEIPKFIWALTMQNHSPYTTKNFGEDAIYVHVSGDSLSESSKDALEGFVNGIYESDRRIELIIDYLKETKKPTILMFFGDHKPGFYDVYEELKMISNKDTTKWSIDEMMKMHEGTYFIYQNFENENKIDKNEDVGAIHLGNMLLNLSGIKKSSMFNFIDTVPYKALRDRLFVDENNVAYEEISSENLNKINQHKLLQYDMLYGENYVNDFDKEKF